MYSHLDLVRDLWSYLRPYKPRFFLASLCRFVGDVGWLYVPYGLAALVTFFTTYTPGISFTPVYITFSLILLASFLRYGGLHIAKVVGYRLAERIKLDAELRGIQHLFRLDISWHEKENTGNKFKRLERGAEGLARMLRIWINNFIEIGVNFVGIIVILLSFDMGIGVAVVFFLVTFYFISRTYRVLGVAVSDVVSAKEEHVSGLLFESINNIRSVKVMSMAGALWEKLDSAIADLFKTVMRRVYYFQTGNTLRHLWGQLFRVGSAAFIVYGIVQGRYEVGFLVLFWNYFSTIWTSIAEFADVADDFAVAKQAIGRMQSIISTPIVIDREEGKRRFPIEWKTISVKNLSFSYSDRRVLEDVSFDIQRGERVGIVGLSGAGKSTLFKLLLKEHETYSGEISFDGVPLQNISRQDYFNHLAVVLQDTELFNMTLRENITITNMKEEKNGVLLGRSLEVAHVKDFMEKMPQGVDSLVGEKGIKLSGGEKQRVGIARAVFKDPQILLLDEATSHLDIESEEKIRESLHEFFQSVTAIVIAHRLTTIKEMDKIIVLEDGKIVETGSFNDLYKKKGRFYELWEKQKL